MRKDEEEYGRRLIVIGPEGSPLSYIACTFRHPTGFGHTMLAWDATPGSELNNVRSEDVTVFNVKRLSPVLTNWRRAPAVVQPTSWSGVTWPESRPGLISCVAVATGMA